MNSCNKKYYRTLFLLILSLLIVNSSFLIGTVRYVSKTGLSIPPYTSWETAADSIQKCINICVFGDTIYVANGVYEEQVVMIPGLALIGAGMDSCLIKFQSTGFAVNIASNCLLEGFKITVPHTFNTGGIFGGGSNSTVTFNRILNASQGIYVPNNSIYVYNNIFENIITRGISIFNSNSTIRNNIIITDPNSQAGQITGIYIGAFNNNYQPIIDSNYIVVRSGKGIEKSFGARPIIKNNFITFTQYGAGAIYVYSSDSAFIYNNLILIGTGIRGIYNSSVPYMHVINNYIQGRSITSPSGMLVGGSNIVKNNVVVNTVTGIEAGGIQNLVVQYNNLWNNNTNYSGFTPDTTNISFNPLIINDDTTQGKLDFHLQMFSPLIDAGDPNIIDKDSTRSDIGLYGGPYGESYAYIDFPPRPPVNLTAAVDSSIVTLRWNKNTEADFSYYNLFYDTTKNFQIDPTKLISSQPDTFYYFVIPTGVERLYFKLTAVDNQGNESNPSEELPVILVSVINEWKPVNSYILYQNYPNPFNPSTKIGFKLKERGYVKLYVYDIKGELVSVLVNQTQEAGYYEVEFNAEVGNGQSAVGKSLASGVYIYQIFVKGENNIPVFSDIKKMMYVK